MTIDRLAARARPSGTPIMHQNWTKLLFLHWSFDPEQLRPELPRALELDTFDGRAWIGITPFTMSGIRPTFLPAVPGLSDTHELNVRTYVHRDGVPGVWFFSLDADNALAVAAARAAFRLPYFHAEMSLEESDATVSFRSRRKGDESPPTLEARWTRTDPLPPLEPGTLDFFLIERYWLYAADESRLLRARIHHEPWPLCRAEVHELRSTMLTAQGLPAGEGDPLVHAQREALHVEVWKPEALD
jgi:uncharacterized protein